MTNKLTEKASKATENITKIWQIERLLDQMNVSLDNRDYGITGPERLNCMEHVKIFKKRMEDILAKEIPEPES